MENRILALIDLSETTNEIYPSISYFYKIIGGKLVLVHETQKLIPSFTDSEQKKKLINEEKKAAISNIKAHSNLLELGDIEVKVTEKNIVNYINELESDKQDWVIAGLKPHDNFKSFFSKSTVLKLIEETHSIKLIVPCKKGISTIKHLRMATHYKFPVNLDKLKLIIQTFSPVLETLTFYTIIDEGDDFFKIESHLNELVAFFPNQRIATETIPKAQTNDIIGVKVDYETLLVVQKGPRDFLDLIFRKLTINRVLESNVAPLIILPKN